MKGKGKISNPSYDLTTTVEREPHLQNSTCHRVILRSQGRDFVLDHGLYLFQKWFWRSVFSSVQSLISFPPQFVDWRLPTEERKVFMMLRSREGQERVSYVDPGVRGGSDLKPRSKVIPDGVWERAFKIQVIPRLVGSVTEEAKRIGLQAPGEETITSGAPVQ